MRNIARIAKRVLPEGRCKDYLRAKYLEMTARRQVIRDNGEDLVGTYHSKFGKDASYISFSKGPLAGQRIFFEGIQQKHVLSSIYELPSYFTGAPIPEEALVIDAGAFQGDFSVAAAHFAAKGKVLALEPDPANRNCLEKTVAANGMQSRIEVLPLAVSDRSASLRLCQAEMSSQVVKGQEPGDRPVVSVEAVTIDELISQYDAAAGRPVFVKMDIEGHELEAYAGAPKTIRRGARFAIAAYHMVDGKKTAEPLMMWFGRDGYDASVKYPTHLTLVASPRH